MIVFPKLGSGCPSTIIIIIIIIIILIIVIIIIIMIVFPKLASGCPLPINQLPANLQCIKAQKFSTCRNFSTYIKLLSSLISTEGALRLPTTYDNQSHPQSLFNHLNRPWIDLSQPPITPMTFTASNDLQ